MFDLPFGFITQRARLNLLLNFSGGQVGGPSRFYADDLTAFLKRTNLANKTWDFGRRRCARSDYL